jgi:hypothetical protein
MIAALPFTVGYIFVRISDGAPPPGGIILVAGVTGAGFVMTVLVFSPTNGVAMQCPHKRRPPMRRHMMSDPIHGEILRLSSFQ